MQDMIMRKILQPASRRGFLKAARSAKMTPDRLAG
jgi:hypothetical protein